MDRAHGPETQRMHGIVEMLMFWARLPTSLVSLFVTALLAPSTPTEVEILEEICVVPMTAYEWTRPEAAALCNPVMACAMLLVWLVAQMALYAVVKPYLERLVRRFVRSLFEDENIETEFTVDYLGFFRDDMETVFRQLEMLARERYQPVLLPDGTFALAVVMPVIPAIPPPPKQGSAAKVALLGVIVAGAVVCAWTHGLLGAAEPAPEPEPAAPVASDPTPSPAPMDLYRVLEIVAQLNAGAVLVLYNMIA
jgi:hypothetical protein